jgi:hypothetical protein
VFTVADLKSNISAAVPYTYYANEFTSTSTADSAYVRLTGGVKPSEWTNTLRPTFQVVVRGAELNGPTVEAKANAIWAYYHQKRNFTIGTTQILACFADQAAPMYLGRDSANRPLYSLNFTLVLQN